MHPPTPTPKQQPQAVHETVPPTLTRGSAGRPGSKESGRSACCRSAARTYHTALHRINAAADPDGTQTSHLGRDVPKRGQITQLRRYGAIQSIVAQVQKSATRANHHDFTSSLQAYRTNVTDASSTTARTQCLSSCPSLVGCCPKSCYRWHSRICDSTFAQYMSHTDTGARWTRSEFAQALPQSCQQFQRGRDAARKLITADDKVAAAQICNENLAYLPHTFATYTLHHPTASTPNRGRKCTV
jgi:hypothetical protein